MFLEKACDPGSGSLPLRIVCLIEKDDPPGAGGDTLECAGGMREEPCHGFFRYFLPRSNPHHDGGYIGSEDDPFRKRHPHRIESHNRHHHSGN
jgi:hypothetical protein